MMFNTKKILISTTLLFFLGVSVVSAASVTLRSSGVSVAGQVLSLDVLADPEGVSINSVDISVSFDSARYTFTGYEQNESAIGLWVATPKEKGGVVQFAGVIPGGVERLYDPMHPDQRGIPLVRLLFLPKSEGSGTFTIQSATLLQNDGNGTPLAATRGTVAVQTVPSSQNAVAQLTDKQPPTVFTLERVPGAAFSRNPDMVVFSAVDDESGIERYEVSFNGRTFTEAQSPFVLPRRLFPYTLTARAIDFAGNYRDAQLFVPGAGGTPYLITIALIGAVAIVIYIYRQRRSH